MNAVAKIEVATPPIRAEEQHFSLMQRKAALFASSPLIPESLRAGGQQQALANCYIGLTMAEAMQENPLTVLQNIHVVKGKAGFSAQFMIARANASGVFKDRIDWRIDGKGDSLSVTAYAIVNDSGQEVSVTVDMAMAKAESWTSNPKYKSMPEVMLRYRSATFLVRFYAPEVMFGYHAVEEVEDMAYAAAPSLAARPLTGAALIEQASDTADPVMGDLLPADNPAPAADPDDSDDARHARAMRRPDGQPGYDIAGPGTPAINPAIMRSVADSLIERIGRAETVIAVRNLKSTAPAEMSDDMLAEIEAAAAERDAALRAPR